MKSGVTFNCADILKELGIEVSDIQEAYGQGQVVTGKDGHLEVAVGGCSYCGKPTETSTVTEGRGPLKRRIEVELIRSPQTGKVITFEEVTKFSSRKLLACPDCCLQLVGRTKFPDFD